MNAISRDVMTVADTVTMRQDRSDTLLVETAHSLVTSVGLARTVSLGMFK